MNRPPPSSLLRLELGGEAFFCSEQPRAAGDETVEARLAEAVAAAPGGAPTLLYWDAEPTEALPGGLHLGRGGLDPVLAAEIDLAGCIGVGERAYNRLVDRGAIKADTSLGRAAALLARSAGVQSIWCGGVLGRIDLAARPPMGVVLGAASHAESISVVLLVDERPEVVEPFFAALKGQSITSRIDLVVIALNVDGPGLKTLTRALEAGVAADPRVKFRRYSVSGALSRAYLANLGVGLAGSEAVVVAEAACIPITPNAIQRLADWALSGEAAAACPRLVFDGKLLSAGLALRHLDVEEPELTAWRDEAASTVLRTAAAPAPGLFAVRRTAWIAAGGLRGAADPALWTAEFAFASGPRGRTFLVGSEVAEWVGSERPALWNATARAHRRLQPPAATSVCDPRIVPEGVPVRLAIPGPAAPRDAEPRPAVAVAFSDPFPNFAAAKLLVFADAYGASQSIAFVDGLAGARERGEAAVRILEERAFPGDSRTLAQSSALALVEAQFDETAPDVAVVSRLGHPGVWEAVRAVARRRGTPILMHLDDEILELPAVIGTERYRLGRNAKRLQTLRAALAEADLVLASTPALAERLTAHGRRGGIAALTYGAFGVPARREPAPAGAPLVVGYMGSASHDYDLALAAPALNRILADYPNVRVSLFGTIAEQPSARLIQGRVERIEPVQRDYAGFRRRLAGLSFDIGLAPLRDSAFNRVKTPTKWVEYAGAGAVTLASPVLPYLPMIEAGAAVGAEEHQWEAGLRRLIEDHRLRAAVAARADALLAARFAPERLEDEVLAAIQRVIALKAAA